MRAPTEITCVDCLGPCRLQQHPDHDFAPGDIASYRCRDCADVWYIELEAEDDVDLGR